MHWALKVLVVLFVGFLAYNIMGANTPPSHFPGLETGDSRGMAPGAVHNPRPLPALFVSHGGPTFLYEEDDFGNRGAWRAVRRLGNRVKTEWKPDYIIVVSAHWQLSDPNLVEVAVPPGSVGKDQKSGGVGAVDGLGDLKENPLIYDFYGFPDHMYKERFRTWNSQVVATLVSECLAAKGFQAKLTERGLDHGVWVPLKIAFSQDVASDAMALPDTPLIQVSLPRDDFDFDAPAKLGEALARLQNTMIWDPVRSKHLRGLIVCSGMSVHNLRDLGAAVQLGKKALPYAAEFSRLVSETLQAESDSVAGLAKLTAEHKALFRKAHPTLEHFAPLVVAAGVNRASGNRKVIELYNDQQLSLAWGTYQFGEYE